MFIMKTIVRLHKINLGFFIVLMLCLCSSTSAQSQYDKNGDFEPSRVYVGGSFGLQFGTEDFLDISPQIAYSVTPYFTFGVGLSYQKYSSKSLDYTDNVYGAKVFSRLYIMDLFYLHAEYEYSAIEAIKSNGNIIQNFNSINFLVGIGYREWIGPNLFTSATILWNLNNRYANGSNEPIFRVGFGFGL